MEKMKRINLNQEVVKALKLAIGFDDFVNIVCDEINKGYAAIFQSDKGYMILRYEQQVKELVIIALIGKNIIDDCYQFALSEAKRLGAKSIRFHSSLKGFERISKSYGFDVLEIVYRKEIV